MKSIVTGVCLLTVVCSTSYAASASDLTWTVDNGEVTITDCQRLASGSLAIPATLGGGPGNDHRPIRL